MNQYFASVLVNTDLSLHIERWLINLLMPLIKSYGKAIVHNECLPVYRSLLGFAYYYRKPDNTHALSIGIFIYCKMYRFIIAKTIAIEQTYKTRLSRFHNIL